MIIDSPIISGSYAASGSLNQLGNVVISGSLTVTGSIIGTASFAETASYLSGYVSPFPFTGSAIISGSLEVTGSANIPNITGSLSGSLNGTASYAVTASNAVTASYLTGYVSPFPFTGSAVISGSLGVTGSLQVTNLSGSGVRYLVADESGSVTAQSASAALKSTQAFTSTAGQTTFSVTNGYATGYVDVFINGSKLSAAEFTDTSGTNIVLATGSFDGDVVEVVKYTPAAGVTNNVLRQLTTLTGSAGQTVFSASYTPGLLDIFYNGSRLSTSDYTANNGTYFTLATASAADDILDVLVYSYQVGAFNGIGGQGVVNQLAFFNTTSSITGSNSFAVSGNTLVGTASYALNADTLDGVHLSTLATTGSNTFTSAQYISNTSTPIGFTDTASLYTDGGLRATKTSYFSSSVYIGGDLIIFGSQSVNYITSSQLNIADNIITLNTSSPAVRFGGIAVQDSGSLATGLTGSLLWDSQTNHWIYSNPSGSSYSGGMMISGPRNTGSIGDEQGTTFNALMKGQGGDHITSSGIFENGLSASFYNNALVVSASGKVGIGNTNPSFALTVQVDSTDMISWKSPSYEVGRLGLDTNNAHGAIFLFSSGSQTIQISAKSGAYTYFNAGNVGIGTASPSNNHKLEVNGATATTGINLGNMSSLGSLGSGYLYLPYTGGIGFRSADGSAAKALIQGDNSSNLLLNPSGGTVAVGNSSPQTLFSANVRGIVFGNYSSISSNSSSGWTSLANNAAQTIGSSESSGWSYQNTDAAARFGLTNGAFIFQISGTGTAGTAISWTDAVTITNAATGGKVGIGTNTPLSALHQVGGGAYYTADARFGGSTTAFGVEIKYDQGGATSGTLYCSPGYSNAGITFKIGAGSGNTNQLILLGTGNVGIGVTPTEKLHIYSSAGPEFRMEGGAFSWYIRAYNDNFNVLTPTGRQAISYLNNGDVRNYNNTTTWQTTSDVRVKENINTIPNALDKIIALNPVTFDYKQEFADKNNWDDNKKINNVGFIAQEFETIFPKYISTNKYEMTETIIDDLKSIDTGHLVAYLVKAIQEQQTLITALQEKLERNNIN